MPVPPLRPLQKVNDGVLHCQDLARSQPTDFGHAQWDLSPR
jgi:hypothetical protein